VIPLAKALAGYDASLTGRKAFQNSERAQLPRFEVDTSDAAGRLKINPLIDWTPEDIKAYFDWDKTECGIHQPGEDDGDLPPGYEPFL